MRHPQLRKAFRADTEAWLLRTRQQAKKWRGKRLAEPVASVAIDVQSAASQLSAAGQRQLQSMIAAALGEMSVLWVWVVCGQP